MTYRSVLLGASILMIAVPAFAGPTPPSYVPDLLPPNPVAGECYGRVEIPARYETTTQRVVTRDAYQRVLVQQPQLQSTTQRVMVKEPSVRYVVQQPTYGTVTERVLTRPGFDKLTVSEPSFRTVTETLHTGQPRLVWKRGNPTKLRAQGYKIHSTADGGVGGRGYSSTTEYGRSGGQRCGSACEIWCLVEEPGESVTVTRQVMSHSAQVHRTPIQPHYETITKQVVTHPGWVKKIPVQGEYHNLHVEKLVHPGGTATINVQPEYDHVQGKKLVSASRYEWRRIVCKPGYQHGAARQSTLESQPIGHSNRTSVRSQQVSPYQTGHVNTYSNSSAQNRVLSGTISYAPGTTPRYHPASTTGVRQAPLHGTLTQMQPAYTSAYRNASATHGTTYSSQPVAYSGSANTTVTETSSGYPDRTYSGPAYVDQSQREITRYESRQGPSRTRR